MADHAVGNEVACAGGDVVEAHRHAERADRGHAQLGGGLEGAALDRALARDRRIGAEEEAHPLGEATAQTNRGHAIAGQRSRLSGIVKAKAAESCLDPRENLRIGVRDSKDVLAARTLGVEDAREEPLHPRQTGQDWPADQIRDALDVALCLRAYRSHRPVIAGSLRERELGRGHAEAREVLPGAVQRLGVSKGKAKSVYCTRRTVSACVDVGANVSVTTDDTTEVTTPVLVVHDRSVDATAGAEQLAVRREVRPLRCPVLCSEHVLPAASCEKSMILACNQLCAVLERDRVGRLTLDHLSRTGVIPNRRYLPTRTVP